jgi:isopenicillin N synthase-like dioxygenase
MNAIPVIDASRLDAVETLCAIDEACRKWGFFQVVHHGVGPGACAALLREARAFFALPLSAKRRVARSADNPWGFYDRELTKNTPDWKQVFDRGPNDDRNPTPWPHERAALRAAIEGYAAPCERLAFRLLAAISRNLGMAPGALAQGFRPRNTSFLRLNYYPECSAPAHPEEVATPEQGHLGVNHHTDAGALTLLLQDDQPGLEVHHEGEWLSVEPLRDALVVNIGDIVQVWSNDRYRAAIHRVVASSDRSRFSAPFFLNPAYETRYAPLPTTVDARRLARYRPIEWGEFRTRRALGDYEDRGAEVQIDQYRIEISSTQTISQETPHGPY